MIRPEHPEIGEEVTITVWAMAEAGVDIFWWYGSGTGIAELDRAHIMSGNGAWFTSYTWTIVIDEPGTYIFGADARDLSNWLMADLGRLDDLSNLATFDHTRGRLASETCGLAFETIEVHPDLHRSYSVGFVLLAPEDTDLSDPSFQEQLTKLEVIKAALPPQFATATYMRGTCDTSYPTVVLMPPGPIPDLHDDGTVPVVIFVRSTILDYFYSDHPDVFDFLAVYEAYPDKTIASRHIDVRKKVAGLGMIPYDNSDNWGQTVRLCGVGLITDITELPATYDFMESDMPLLLHETFGHQ